MFNFGMASSGDPNAASVQNLMVAAGKGQPGQANPNDPNASSIANLVRMMQQQQKDQPGMAAPGQSPATAISGAKPGLSPDVASAYSSFGQMASPQGMAFMGLL